MELDLDSVCTGKTSHNRAKKHPNRDCGSELQPEIIESESRMPRFLPPNSFHPKFLLSMKRKQLFALLIFLIFAGAASSPAATEPVQVLILGTYHFDNPQRDLHNMKAEDVRTPAKQADLADIATRLARFNPNKIAVEAVSDRGDLTTKKFDAFTPETLTKDADERVQIAFRLANKLGHKSVYGIDEQSDKIDYFPYDKVQDYAKTHGNTATLDALNAEVATMINKMEAEQKTKSVREMLVWQNQPDRIEADHKNFYYALLPMGDSNTQPGADLNGYWYLRNAKIFAKLSQIAKPGDRILVTFGAGHCYWLRHLVRNTPGFTLVEANDYLR